MNKENVTDPKRFFEGLLKQENRKIIELFAAGKPRQEKKEGKVIYVDFQNEQEV
jgi:hypothetical protein